MKLMKMGTMASINQEVSEEIASLVVKEYGYTLLTSTEDEEEEQLEIDALMEIEEDKEEDLLPRPPVVTVMKMFTMGKLLY